MVKGKSQRGDNRKPMTEMSKNICPHCSHYSPGHLLSCRKHPKNRNKKA